MDLYPLRMEARCNESLSRWLWLVKWLLLLPHYLALAVLWTGLVVLTVVAYLAVLFTGRYPEPIRAYNVGVLRWTWRVGYYGYQALGTDAYPPFTLADDPQYPARLHLEPHDPPRRWLPLVAWLFAIPHLTLLGALHATGSRSTEPPTPLGVTALLLLIAAFALLFTGRYPGGLHDLLVGVARWTLRVTAYIVLLVPSYPPFRLDQGGFEPDPAPAGPVAMPAPRPAPQPSVTGSVVALVAGVLLLLPAVGLSTGGAVLLAVDAARDSAGYVTSPVQQLETSTAAITAEHVTVSGAGVWTRETTDLGDLRLDVTTTAGQPIFVGVAPQSAVDTWLAGTAHDEVTGFGSGAARYDRAGARIRPASTPASQPFWIAQASGSDSTTLQWTATDGEYAVVVANVTGASGVSVDVRGAARVPDLTGLGSGLLAAGILIGLLAVGLIVAGGTGLGRRHSGPTPADPPVDPPPRIKPPVATGS
ncbi:DUF4389 domain-containing protein [Actinoplanes xinjiangensis]|uniref:Uncharacterized protein DUF4389 n=1 Tax=Actinoplanes xinjiangensis TaxID=512350 RepID=A0A316F5N4_9ACTN|nr:DUF4389 domain-containing protein [Actinoplanes xinjiangensis]PWK39837.1 uncharacterized protein DUF4389 [Actinoplanes xinjiangensis]GIF42804.1 hypothetical protein Axi01nite_71150 [Actinoplanes xinjiangensis]